MSPIIDINNICFGYEKNTVIKDFSLKVEKNSLVFILGPNGVGKSTLLNCIVKQLVPQKGTIVVDGINIKEYRLKDLAKKISYLTQNVYLPFEMTVFDFVLLGRTPYKSLWQKPTKKDREIVNNVLQELDLLKFSNRVLETLSGGEKQKIYIAKALVQNSDIIILDEPTSALDFKAQVDVLKLLIQLREKGKTIIMTTHNPNFPLWCNCFVLLISNEKYLYGNAGDVINSYNLSQTFSTQVEIVSNSNGIKTCIPKI